MCRPHSTTPSAVSARPPAIASAASAATRNAMPTKSSVRVRHPVGELADRIGRPANTRRSSRPSPAARRRHRARSCPARRMRKASLKRASVSAAPAAVTPQNARPSAASGRAIEAHALRVVRRPRRRCGLAHRECDQQERQDRGHHGHPEHGAEVVVPREHERHREQRARRRRRPCRATGAGRRPRRALPAGVMSAISASRGAPRMPLPMRSTKRATNTSAGPVASANSGLDSAARP